jgi:isoleucyl-tRNA synthetase
VFFFHSHFFLTKIELTHDQIVLFQKSGEIVVEGHTLTFAELQIVKKYNGDTKKFEAAWDENVVTILDVEATEDMREEGLAREIMNRVQKLRKKAGISFSDPIEVYYKVDAKGSLANVVVHRNSFIMGVIGVGFVPLAERPSSYVEIISEESNVLGSKLFLSVCRLAVSFSEAALKEKYQDAQFVLDVQTYLYSKDYSTLLKSFKDNSM